MSAESRIAALERRIKGLELAISQHRQTPARGLAEIFRGSPLRLYHGKRRGGDYWELVTVDDGQMEISSWTVRAGDDPTSRWRIRLPADPVDDDMFGSGWDHVLTLREIDVCADGAAKKAVVLMSAPYEATP